MRFHCVLLVDDHVHIWHLEWMEPEIFNRRLGIILRKLRMENGLTQHELAKHTGLSRGTIANMEIGRQTMSAYQAYQIATVFQLESVEPLYPMIAQTMDEVSIGFHHPPDLNDTQRQQLRVFMNRYVT